MSHPINDILIDNLRENLDNGKRLKEVYFRKSEPRIDNAYLNQLKLDQDIFNGLLPELEKNLNA